MGQSRASNLGLIQPIEADVDPTGWQFEILFKMDFDSDRKRMTIVAQNKQEDPMNVKIFTKGADRNI